MHNAWITTSGEKMSKSLGNSLLVPSVLERVRGIELRYYMVAAHYRSTVEFSFEALEESASAFRRIEDFLQRYGAPGELEARPQAFDDAMDDDLSTPAAVAVIHETMREGNRLANVRDPEGAAKAAGRVRAMLAVLGLDPDDPHWATGESSSDLHGWSTYSSRACSNVGPRHGQPRTSPQPTPSATRSRPPASRSRTPPTDRSGACRRAW